MPTPQGRAPSTKKRRERRKKVQKRFQKAVKVQHLKIKKLQKLSLLKHRQNASTTRILPEFDFDNVKEIPENSVKELQPTSGNSGKSSSLCYS